MNGETPSFSTRVSLSTMAKKQRIAFVAMRFSGDHWNDKNYLVIKEVVEEAGFKCIRADEIKTSGAVVDEVCIYLRDADLVVIDSSGDSQSVAYEIGYCHGVQRPPQRTLLLRDIANLPFNFRHYRHRVYSDTRHLRKLIRDFLDIYEPLRPDQCGYTFTFEFSDQAHHGYIFDGAVCIFTALQQLKFTGRCDCWSMEQFGRDRLFSVGILLKRPKRPPTPDYDFWMKVAERVERLAAKTKGRITYVPACSELSEKRAIQDGLLFCGAAQFDSGEIAHILAIPEDSESFFDHFVGEYANKA